MILARQDDIFWIQVRRNKTSKKIRISKASMKEHDKQKDEKKARQTRRLEETGQFS